MIVKQEVISFVLDCREELVQISFFASYLLQTSWQVRKILASLAKPLHFPESWRRIRDISHLGCNFGDSKKNSRRLSQFFLLQLNSYINERRCSLSRHNQETIQNLSYKKMLPSCTKIIDKQTEHVDWLAIYSFAPTFIKF